MTKVVSRNLPSGCGGREPSGFLSSEATLHPLIREEGALRDFLHCDEAARLDIDFAQVAVIPVETVMGTTFEVAWARLDESVLHLTLATSPYCGGAAPQSQLTELLLVPAEAKSVEVTNCGARSCNFTGPPPP